MITDVGTWNLSKANAYVIRSSAWLSTLLMEMSSHIYRDKYYASISREGFLFPKRSIELRTVWLVYMYVFVCGRAAAGKKSLTRDGFPDEAFCWKSSTFASFCPANAEPPDDVSTLFARGKKRRNDVSFLVRESCKSNFTAF